MRGALQREGCGGEEALQGEGCEREEALQGEGVEERWHYKVSDVEEKFGQEKRWPVNLLVLMTVLLSQAECWKRLKLNLKSFGRTLL